MNDVIDRSTETGPGGLAPELEDLSDDRLTVGYDEILVASRQADWERLAFEAEIERRRMYVTDGTSSLQEWISTRTAEGERAAYHQAKVACRLPYFPELSEALASGRISVLHVGLLLTLAGLTGAEDAELVAAGQTHTVPQLEMAVRSARRLSRQGDGEAQARRHLRWRQDDNGTVHLHGRLHGIDGLTVTSRLAAMAEASRPDPTAGRHDSFDTRCADALVDLCAHPDDTPARRAEVVIHVPIDALAQQTDQTEADPTEPGHDDTESVHETRPGSYEGAMTWDGTVIGTDTVQRLLCDGRIRLAVDDLRGRTIGIGYRSRTIPEWLAEQVRRRDGSCRFPGCERTRWLHSHHLIHWPHGPTDMANLLTLCGRHHRAVHEGPWQVCGDPDGRLTFTGPSGPAYLSHPAIRSAELLSPRRRRRRRAPTKHADRPRGPAPGGP